MQYLNGFEGEVASACISLRPEMKNGVPLVPQESGVRSRVRKEDVPGFEDRDRFSQSSYESLS